MCRCAARKVLYLLHGLSDDASAWQRNSSIETYAQGVRAGGGDALGEPQLLHRPAQRAELFHLHRRGTAALPEGCVRAGAQTRGYADRGALDGRIRRLQGGAAAPGDVLGGSQLFGGVIHGDDARQAG